MINNEIQFDENILFSSFSGFSEPGNSWKVLIADDEKEVHTVTKMVLNDVTFDGKPIQFLSTYSGEETKKIIKENNDIAVILLDVVMEKENTGLEVVKYIREELCNKKVRIILRTGQAGNTPERDVIDNFDINDYKQKTELTSQKLYTALTVGLRSYRDIIRLEESQEKINIIKLFLHKIPESMSSGLIVVNNNFLVTLCNGIAKKLISNENTPILGKNIFEISDFIKIYETEFNQSLNNNAPKTIYNISKLTNTYFNIMIYPFNFHQFQGLVIRIDDVSELVVRDEQIKRMQKLDTIGTLAAGLAHDFNNILGGISGAVSLMKIEMPQLSEKSLIKTGIETVDESVKRASDIVKKLLTISKKQNTVFTPIELNSLVKNIMSICEKSLDKSVETKISYYNENSLINGDVSQIEQAILNLSINAAHAMTIMRPEEKTKGGILNISIYPAKQNDEIYINHYTTYENKFYVLEIKDTGVGIPEDIRNKIFDPFFTTKKKNTGTGLGLSMVYNTVAQHGGYIILDSELNKGSTFKLYFPKLEVPKEEYSTPHSLKTGSGNIIIADDEPAIIQVLKKTLEICGYTVYPCETGKEVIDTYKNNKIDLVITDNDMPNLTGVGVFRILLELYSNVKLVFISGHEMDSEVSKCIDDGALGLISKPFNMQNFSKMVYNMMNGIEPHDA